MLVQAWLADCWRFYALVLLWLTAWILICFPWSLHPGQWAVWALFLSTAFSLGPTLSWLCDQKHEKPVPCKQRQIKGRQLKNLDRRQLASALKPVRVPSLEVRLLAGVMAPFAYAVSQCPASHILLAVAYAAVQSAEMLLIDVCTYLLSGLLALLAAAAAALFRTVLHLTRLQYPSRLHWAFLLGMRDRFIMSGRFAKSSALWSLVLGFNNVPEA